ncbi:MAG: hypothetical protein SGBAC_010849 [Bacillariaceae sp.]
MNTKLFWEKVNKRMKYERAQRLQRRRTAGVKRSVKIDQMEVEKQLQIECLLQVLEEHVTASLLHPEGHYDSERLSEDVDIITIAVQKLKKDMTDDLLLAAGASIETENVRDTESLGLSLALKVLDGLTEDTISNKENGKHGFDSSLNSKEEEYEEDKENLTTKLSEADREEVLDKDGSVTASDIPSVSNKNFGINDTETGKFLASLEDVSESSPHDATARDTPSSDQSSLTQFNDHDIIPDTVANVTDSGGNTPAGEIQGGLVAREDEPLKEGDGGSNNGGDVEEDSTMVDPVEGNAEKSGWHDAIVDLAAESTGAEIVSVLTTVATKNEQSQPAAVTSDRSYFNTSEPSQNKDTFRFLKKPKFAINRTKTNKQSIWSRKMPSWSEKQELSQFEKDMRKEKPKFNLNGDTVLLKAITSLKKNLKQEKAEEGPNPEPLPQNLRNAVHNLDSVVTS